MSREVETINVFLFVLLGGGEMGVEWGVLFLGVSFLLSFGFGCMIFIWGIREIFIVIFGGLVSIVKDGLF